MTRNKKLIIIGCLTVILVLLLTWISFYDKKETPKHPLNDYTSLNGDYSSFNVYKNFKDFEDTTLKNGEHIVYLGKPNCPWCKQYIAYYDKVAKETDKKINVYNLDYLKGKLTNTETGIQSYGVDYQKMYDLIYEFDKTSDYELTGIHKNTYTVYVPIIFKIKDGIIVDVVGEVKGHTMGENGLRELTDLEKENFINDLRRLFK